MLGEFTPWHTGGRMHCDMRPLPSQPLGQSSSQSSSSSSSIQGPKGTARRRHGLTHQIDTVDVCTLGRMWRAAGIEEGGTLRSHQPPPSALRNWERLMEDDHAKCRLAAAHLAPVSWRRAAARQNEKLSTTKVRRRRGRRLRSAY